MVFKFSVWVKYSLLPSFVCLLLNFPKEIPLYKVSAKINPDNNISIFSLALTSWHIGLH